MDIIKALNWRYAVKKFDSTKKVSDEDFNKLLEAIRLTPSSFGLQGWKFVVVQSPELRKELVPHAWNQQQITEASHLLVLCRTSDMTDDQIIQHGKDVVEARNIEWEDITPYVNLIKSYTEAMDISKRKDWLSKQIYVMLGYLMTAAAVLEIDTCPMEGFNPKEFDRILDLEADGLNSVLVVPVGYRSKDDVYSSYKKVRKPLEDLVITK